MPRLCLIGPFGQHLVNCCPGSPQGSPRSSWPIRRSVRDRETRGCYSHDHAPLPAPPAHTRAFFPASAVTVDGWEDLAILTTFRYFEGTRWLVERHDRDEDLEARREWTMIVALARPVGVAALDALTREWLQESQ
jgi:hypothetical protein